MLDKGTMQKIEGFVQVKPRTIQEVAQFIGRNWRTADSYIEQISKEQGTIATRTFRGGTRGALKVVYWNAGEQFHASAVQERLFARIAAGKTKFDFNAFDIYQYVEEEKRRAFLERQTTYKVTEKQNLMSALRSAEGQFLLFAGDLSWSVASQGKVTLLSLLEELAARKVSVKIVCNVDLESMENIEQVLSINHKLKSEYIEIRHAEQPLRAFIIDDRMVRLKQRKLEDIYIFYELMDEGWVSWMQKVFWSLFRAGIGAEERLKDLSSIELIRK